MFNTVRDLPRLREISSVLIRHGLGDLVRRTGTASLLERAGQILQWSDGSDLSHIEPQQRLRLAFEELGPTFVKLGQMLSTREDRPASHRSPPSRADLTCVHFVVRAAAEPAGLAMAVRRRISRPMLHAHPSQSSFRVVARPRHPEE